MKHSLGCPLLRNRVAKFKAVWEGGRVALTGGWFVPFVRESGACSNPPFGSDPRARSYIEGHWAQPQTCFGVLFNTSLRGPAVQAAPRPDTGSRRRTTGAASAGAPQNEFGVAPL